MKTILITFALLTAGCEREANLKPIMPRDGSPIALRLSAPAPELVPTLERAAALWAQTGARFTLDACDGVEVQVRVEALPIDINGRYEWVPAPLITIDPIAVDHLPTVAHELGHVLGVRHLRDDECGIMSVIDCGREELSADDFAAFAEVR